MRSTNNVTSKYLSASEVASLYSISTTSVWNWTNKKILPTPYKIGLNTTRWSSYELDAIDAVRNNDGSLPLPIANILELLRPHKGTTEDFVDLIQKLLLKNADNKVYRRGA